MRFKANLEEEENAMFD